MALILAANQGIADTSVPVEEAEVAALSVTSVGVSDSTTVELSVIPVESATSNPPKSSKSLSDISNRLV